MANDAKLGLVLGVAIVLVIALVFFRSDALEAKAAADPARATTGLKKDVYRARVELSQVSEPERKRGFSRESLACALGSGAGELLSGK